ncbi:MAG: SDR family NAD(P)-dependent oxidoreductase [Ignavibacteria bacterium]
MKLSDNKILITGGASGIGLGLAKRFIEENNTVIICGRQEKVTKEATEKFPSVISRVCDLTNDKTGSIYLTGFRIIIRI